MSPFSSLQFHASLHRSFKAVAKRIELASTPPQLHCFSLPCLQAPKSSYLIL